MRKWIAKMMSTMDYYINKTNQDKNVSFESKLMRIADQMVDDYFVLLDTSYFIYMYEHEDILGMKDLPVQQGSINCGVYSIWHMLVASHEDMPIIDLNPEIF